MDVINIGQKIVLPVLDTESRIFEAAPGVFTIHAATFSSRREALEYYNRLPASKYPVSMKPINVAGKDLWYRITIGNFNDQNQAFEFIKTLKLDNLIEK